MAPFSRLPVTNVWSVGCPTPVLVVAEGGICHLSDAP